MLAEIF